MSKKLAVDKSFVVKSNALVEARYRLSLQESQVVLWLLTQIRPDDEDFKSHKLKIADFAEFIDVRIDRKYGELRKITKRLMQRVMEIYCAKEDRTFQVSWLSWAEYRHKQGIIIIRFDPGLKPYLLQLKSQFTKISITDTLKLKSVYAIRVLELLLQYVSIGSREISIEDMRLYCGIVKDEYINYFDLKRYVIEKAKSEINAKTGYEIDYQEIKESRKVASIEWTIKKKNIEEEKHKKVVEALKDEVNSRSLLIKELMDYGYSKSLASKLLKDNDEVVLKNALKAVSAQIKKNHVKNPRGMLRVAIKEKWHPDKHKRKKDTGKAKELADNDADSDLETESFTLPPDCTPKLKKF